MAIGSDPLPAVVAVMSYSGLGIVRSLGRRGIPVYAIADSPEEVGMTSRYATAVVTPKIIESEEHTIQDLIQLGKRIGRPSVLYATGDSVVLPVSKYRDELKKYYRFLMPDHSVVERLLTKSGLSGAIEELKVPGPRSVIIHNPEKFAESASILEYPVIIKPIFSASWYRHEVTDVIGVRKAILCNDAAEATSWYEKLRPVDPRIILQELIPGDDSELYYVCGYYNRDGVLETAFAGRKLRLTPIHFGSASFVESVPGDELVPAADRLLSPLGYKGLFGVEFKKDPRDGVYKVIEVNVRWGLWDCLSARCGADLAYLAYAREAHVPYRCTRAYRLGVRWVSSRRDLDACIDYHREGSISGLSWMKCLFGETQHAVFACDDVQPAIREVAVMMNDKLSGIRSRLLKK